MRITPLHAEMLAAIPSSLAIFACGASPSADDEASVTTVMSDSSDEAGESSGDGGESMSSGDPTHPSTSVGFFCPWDMPLASECDVWTQDCPAGEKCVPFAAVGRSWDANKCVPVLGEQAPGEPCTWGGLVEATDDCDATSICWDARRVDGQLVGTCIVQCTGAADAPQCPPAASCFIDGNGSIVICLPDCDPLTQDCDEGHGCYWANMQFSCMAMTENIPTSEPCGALADCEPGHVCADAAALPNCAGAACCTRYCNLLDGDAGCVAQPGTACVPFFDEGRAPLGDEHVGVCIVPA
jgi:hypothetical protein